MKEKALEVLKIFENNGFQAYIVGGFVRDYILLAESAAEIKSHFHKKTAG